MLDFGLRFISKRRGVHAEERWEGVVKGCCLCVGWVGAFHAARMDLCCEMDQDPRGSL